MLRSGTQKKAGRPLDYVHRHTITAVSDSFSKISIEPANSVSTDLKIQCIDWQPLTDYMGRRLGFVLGMEKGNLRMVQFARSPLWGNIYS